uniref:Uncharacterized protein n=1 Tax=Brassica oleracea TaxID=3712 RepID=A0A3P6EFL2_BRAOL|nr:unnamed protein product [Brassica oleracea]
MLKSCVPSNGDAAVLHHDLSSSTLLPLFSPSLTSCHLSSVSVWRLVCTAITRSSQSRSFHRRTT